MTTETSPPPPPAAAVPPAGPEPRPATRGRSRAIVLAVVGVVAGLTAFAGISRFGESFPIDRKVLPLMDLQSPSDEDNAKIRAAVLVRNYKNTALSLGIFGAIVGAALGLAEGTLRRRAKAAAAGTAAGVLFGGAFGAGAGLLAVLLDARLRTGPDDATLATLASSGAAFLVAGIGVGLGAGVGGGHVVRKAGVAPAAGLVAGILYPVLAAVIFPVSDTNVAKPAEAGPQVLWVVLPAFLMGLAVGRTPGAAGPTVAPEPQPV